MKKMLMNFCPVNCLTKNRLDDTKRLYIEKDSIRIYTQEIKNEEDLLEAMKRAKEKMYNRQWDYVMGKLKDKLEGFLPDSREKT